MEKVKNRHGMLAAIFSLTVSTVLVGSAVSPALSKIGSYFTSASSTEIGLIVTIPCLFILLINLIFPKISAKFDAKTIAITGLVIFVLAGMSGALSANIYVLLVTRALLGIGAGLVIPLATGLIGFYFAQKEQGRLIGFSVAILNMIGIVAMVLSGKLASISWRWAFVLYGLAIVSIILTIIFLPRENISRTSQKMTKHDYKLKLPFVFGMFLTQLIFFTYMTNFAICADGKGLFTITEIGIYMALSSFVGFVFSFFFGKIYKLLGDKMKFLGPVAFACGDILIALAATKVVLVVGACLVGMGFGLLVPFFNMSGCKNVPKEKANNAMSAIAIGQFGGQFLSALLIGLLKLIFGTDSIIFPFWVAVVLCALLFVLLIFSKPTKVGEITADKLVAKKENNQESKNK